MGKKSFYRVDMNKCIDSIYFDEHNKGFSNAYLDKYLLRHGDVYSNDELRIRGINPKSKEGKKLLVKVSIDENDYVQSRLGGLIPKSMFNCKKPKLVEKGYKTNRFNCLSYFSDKGGISFKK